jgi:hypothetical protein
VAGRALNHCSRSKRPIAATAVQTSLDTSQPFDITHSSVSKLPLMAADLATCRFQGAGGFTASLSHFKTFS